MQKAINNLITNFDIRLTTMNNVSLISKINLFINVFIYQFKILDLNNWNASFQKKKVSEVYSSVSDTFQRLMKLNYIFGIIRNLILISYNILF